MSKEQKAYVEGLRQEIRNLQIELANKQTELDKKDKQLYSSDFVYFLFSLAIPWGWAEMDLIPHNSIWHVVFGFGLWILPVIVGCHIAWRWLSFRNVPKVLSAALLVLIVGGFVFGFKHTVSRFREHILEEREESLFQNLHGSVTPAPLGKIVDTVFTLRNDSTEKISFMAFCGIHKVVGDNGTKSIEELSVSDLTFGGMLGPGGDSKSGQCVSQINTLAARIFLALIEHIQCADIELLVKYSLADSPERQRKKSIRFVGIDSADQYIWMQQPTSQEKGSYCDALIKQLPQPSR